jgi:hypothetical protein
LIPGKPHFLNQFNPWEMKRIVNFFAPDAYDPFTEIRSKKQKPVAQRATSFFSKIVQHLAGTYSVLSQMSNETETYLEAEEQKNRARQKERSESFPPQQTRTSLLDYRLKIPEHILVKRVQSL